MAIPLGLNVWQILQNELLSREGSRQTLGLGFRLATLETKLNNAEAISRNSRVWKLHHSITPVCAITPEARRAGRAEEQRLAKLKNGHGYKDTRDPVKMVRDEEVWGVCPGFPRTVREFKDLQFEPGRIRDLMEFYDVPAYWEDEKLIEIHPDNGLRDISMNIETCMEELAMSFGLNWHRIDGLVLPQMVPPGTQTPSSRQRQHYRHSNGPESVYSV